MGGRCSCPSPDHTYEDGHAAVVTGAGSARKKAPGERVAVAQSPPRVTKTLFMCSGSEDSSSEDEITVAASTIARNARHSHTSDDSNKENGVAGGEFRHRVRRSERLQQYAASPVRGRRTRSPPKERRRRVSPHYDASSPLTGRRGPASHRCVCRGSTAIIGSNDAQLRQATHAVLASLSVPCVLYNGQRAVRITINIVEQPVGATHQ